MKFEVVNDKNNVLMNTTSTECIPNKDTLNLMSKVGYKFKLNGKVVTIRKLYETLKEKDDGKNN